MATKTKLTWKAVKTGKRKEDEVLRDKQRLVKAEKALLADGVKQDDPGDLRYLSKHGTPFLRVVLTAEQVPSLGTSTLDSFLWFDIYSSLSQRSQPDGSFQYDRFYIEPTHGTRIDVAVAWANNVAAGMAYLQHIFAEIE